MKNPRLKKIGIIAIGDELVNGTVLDKNSNWLAKNLFNQGLEMKKIAIIKDEINEIAKTLNFFLQDEEIKLIITTGGLGPSKNDITLKGIARALKKKLKLNNEALKMLIQKYSFFYKTESPLINSSRKKMALFPENAIPISNPVGVAPGMKIKHRNKTILSLPGVPREMKKMFNKILPEIINEIGKVEKKEVKEVILDADDESKIVSLLSKIQQKVKEVTLKPLVSTLDNKTKIKLQIIIPTIKKEKMNEVIKLLKKEIKIIKYLS